MSKCFAQGVFEITIPNIDDNITGYTEELFGSPYRGPATKLEVRGIVLENVTVHMPNGTRVVLHRLEGDMQFVGYARPVGNPPRFGEAISDPPIVVGGAENE